MKTPAARFANPHHPAWSSFMRIGHGGAGGLAPANTLRSLALALEFGLEMVEFDVRPCRDGLVLLHDDSLAHFGQPQGLASQSSLDEIQRLRSSDGGPVPTLAEALDLLRGRARINIDLKAAGYEQGVLEQVHARGLAGDVIYSSVIPASLRRVRQLDPHAITGLSYPEDTGNASGKSYLKPIVNLALAGMRLALPFHILGLVAAAQANAVMLYHQVVSRRAVQVVQRAGGQVFTWTVDDPARMAALRAMGVNGITSNRPDHFASLKEA